MSISKQIGWSNEANLLYEILKEIKRLQMISSTGRGLMSQTFLAFEGQTTFTVTLFTANSFYLPFIDNVTQDQSVVTRVGNVFTYAPGLHAGQVLLIVN